MNNKFYVVTAVAVETTEDGSKIIHQVPSFLLYTDVHGIVNVEQAETIAKEIINPCNSPRIKVNCCVMGRLSLDI